MDVLGSPTAARDDISLGSEIEAELEISDPTANDDVSIDVVEDEAAVVASSDATANGDVISEGESSGECCLTAELNSRWWGRCILGCFNEWSRVQQVYEAYSLV